MQEWAIRDVARASGLTSRTLRYYEQIGLLHPSRVASNGYRFYGETELSRLYRILSLRALELPLTTIRIVLDDDEPLEEALRVHLSLLRERRDHMMQQIDAVRQTLQAIRKGQVVTISDIFAGIDQSAYENEVRRRWGDEAWEKGITRREDMSKIQRDADDARSLDVNAALRTAAETGIDPDSDSFQALVADHYAWVTDYWGGKKPDRDAYIGLSEMYVVDGRFAATYGGRTNATIIRAAMRTWAEANLA